MRKNVFITRGQGAEQAKYSKFDLREKIPFCAIIIWLLSSIKSLIYCTVAVGMEVSHPLCGRAQTAQVFRAEENMGRREPYVCAVREPLVRGSLASLCLQPQP